MPELPSLLDRIVAALHPRHRRRGCPKMLFVSQPRRAWPAAQGQKRTTRAKPHKDAAACNWSATPAAK
eukprot:12147218-Alexandrium_andersonii.AAC.1